MSQGYFKAQRSGEGLELLKLNKNAFCLLYVIAQRARWSPAFNARGLLPGQAFLGDVEEYGMSQREYRTAKRHLAAHGFASFETTNRGTVATLLTTAVFDLNIQTDDKLETNRRQAGDTQGTTNEEGKKERTEKRERETKSFPASVAASFLFDRVEDFEDLFLGIAEVIRDENAGAMSGGHAWEFFEKNEKRGWITNGKPIACRCRYAAAYLLKIVNDCKHTGYTIEDLKWNSIFDHMREMKGMREAASFEPENPPALERIKGAVKPEASNPAPEPIQSPAVKPEPKPQAKPVPPDSGPFLEGFQYAGDPGFRESWNSYNRLRKQENRPLEVRSANRLLNDLAKKSLEQAVAALNRCIETECIDVL